MNRDQNDSENINHAVCTLTRPKVSRKRGEFEWNMWIKVDRYSFIYNFGLFVTLEFFIVSKILTQLHQAREDRQHSDDAGQNEHKKRQRLKKQSS